MKRERDLKEERERNEERERERNEEREGGREMEKSLFVFRQILGKSLIFVSLLIQTVSQKCVYESRIMIL